MRSGATLGLVGLVVFAAVSAAPTAARAQPADEALSVGARIASVREMLLYARYAEAVPLVDALMARADLLAAERNEVLEIRAILHLARRETAPGMEVLRELYGRDPEHRLIDRDVGPAVAAAFERMHGERPPTATVVLQNGTLPRLDGRMSPAIAVTLTQGANVANELRLSYRNGTSGPFERALMRYEPREGRARARLPMAEGAEAYVVQYFFEVLAPSQAVVATLGSREEPFSIEVPAEVGPGSIGLVPVSGGGTPDTQGGGGSVLEEWWFWTIVGVVVAGGAATVGALAGTGNLEPIGPGTLGEGRL